MAINFLEQQRTNRRRTWMVMLAFVALAVAVGLGFDLFLVGGSQGNVILPVGTLGALGLASASAATSYFAGDRAVIRSAQAVPIDAALASADADSRLKLTQLRNVVEEMAIASGLPVPKVYVVPDP